MRWTGERGTINLGTQIGFRYEYGSKLLCTLKAEVHVGLPEVKLQMPSASGMLMATA